AVVFDAVGTLIHPDPPAAEVYAAAGQRFGSRHAADAIRTRFRAAFAREEAVDHAAGHRTDDAREIRRWQAIVATVLDDVAVGDDLANDYEGATAAGLRAVLLDPRGAAPAGVARVGELAELLSPVSPRPESARGA